MKSPLKCLQNRFQKIFWILLLTSVTAHAQTVPKLQATKTVEIPAGKQFIQISEGPLCFLFVTPAGYDRRISAGEQFEIQSAVVPRRLKDLPAQQVLVFAGMETAPQKTDSLVGQMPLQIYPFSAVANWLKTKSVAIRNPNEPVCSTDLKSIETGDTYDVSCNAPFLLDDFLKHMSLKGTLQPIKDL